MSLFGALFSGVSGLAAQSQAMGIIADNITNVTTTAFKRSTSDFSSLVTGSRTASSFAPGGVQPAVRQLVNVQGLLQISNSPTDLAINGSGFFVVSDVAAAEANTAQLAVPRPGPALPGDGRLQNARKALEDAGAEFESGDAETKRMTVRFDPDRLSRDDVATALEAVGFPPDVEEAR